ncbi:MAG: CBS domain-containing protein [Candidatus Altiarchaeota archaeon]
MLVRDAMSKDPLIVRPDDNALNVGNIMDAKSIGVAVVIEDGEFRGILSKETFVTNLGKLCDRPIESFVVSDLMESDIYSVNEDDDLMEAINLLLVQKSIVDILPVLSEGRVTGLLSKTNMTKVFLDKMVGRYKVADLMHYDPVTVFDYTPLTEVIDEMKNMAVKRVLVLSGDNLVGIISIRDLSLALFRQKKLCNTVDPTSSLTVADIMTRKLTTISRKADAAEAAKVMVERNIGGVPVIDGRLDGIITRSDLLKGYQIAFSQEKR